MHLMMCSRII